MKDGIREHHGVTASGGVMGNSVVQVIVLENGYDVWLRGNAYDVRMTADQARYLASKLYRLSRRIRARQSSTKGE